MGKNREELNRLIHHLEIEGVDVAVDMLKQARTNLHDAYLIAKYVLDNELIHPSRMLEFGCTTVGNTRAELGGFFDICGGDSE